MTVRGWGPLRVVLFVAALLAGTTTMAATPLRLAVMDPLAKQLSCPCVQGHAQRDYEALAAFLGESLGREVTVRFGESLDAFTSEGFDVVIGKRSVVEADAARLGKVEKTSLGLPDGFDADELTGRLSKVEGAIKRMGVKPPAPKGGTK